MHIDGVLVRHVDAHEPQRVLRPRLLAEGQALGRVPVHLRGVELAAVGAVSVDLELDEHALAALGHLLSRRDQVLLDHGRRQRPHRVEGEVGDRRAQQRRRAVGLADDPRVARHHHAFLYGLHLRGGNVHQHIALGDDLGEVRQPLEIGLELREANLGRHVERRDGALVDDAGRRQAVRRLEALHGRVEIRSKVVRIARALGEIAGAHQAPAQDANRRVRGSGLQLHVGHKREAAGRDDLLITGDGGLGRRQVRLRKRRVPLGWIGLPLADEAAVIAAGIGGRTLAYRSERDLRLRRRQPATKHERDAGQRHGNPNPPRAHQPLPSSQNGAECPQVPTGLKNTSAVVV